MILFTTVLYICKAGFYALKTKVQLQTLIQNHHFINSAIVVSSAVVVPDPNYISVDYEKKDEILEARAETMGEVALAAAKKLEGGFQGEKVLRIDRPMTMMTMTATSMAMEAETSWRPIGGSLLALNAAYGDGFTSGLLPYIHHIRSCPQGNRSGRRRKRSTSQKRSILHYISYRAT